MSHLFLRNAIESTATQWLSLERELRRLLDEIPDETRWANVRTKIEDLAKECQDEVSDGTDGLRTFVGTLIPSATPASSVPAPPDVLDTLVDNCIDRLGGKAGPPALGRVLLVKTVQVEFDKLFVPPAGKTFKQHLQSQVTLTSEDEGLLSSIEAAAGSVGDDIDDLLEFIDRRIEDLTELGSLVGKHANIKGIRGSLDDLSSFPILTSDLGPAGYPTTSGGGGGTGTAAPMALQRRVEVGIREVLGRLPRTGDVKSFVAALVQTFEPQEVNGRREFVYRPRSYIGQTELGGGVTGAQASLYASASAGLDNALPLLDGLYALDPKADPEDSEAIRAIVRADLTSLVTELKVEGGPRIARVDRYFEMLIGTTQKPRDLSSGHLFDLQTLFGLFDSRINTIDEELNFSNFLAVRDYTFSIFTNWTTFSDQGGIFGKDLGTRLVLMSRALSVAADAVEEVYAAMDSVFVGPAERQVASFVAFKDRNDTVGKKILVSELLSWVSEFTTEEAPRLIQDGGRLGVISIIPTADLLEDMLRQLVQALPTSPTLPSGLRHTRVLRPLEELRGYVNEVRRLARDLQKPVTKRIR